MKKIFFSTYSLDIGGIETSLVTLLNRLSEKYCITLCLEKKEGIFLDQINENIKVIEYTPNCSKKVFLRKLINMIKRIKFILKYKNQFDFSVCYATYSLACNFTSKLASKNSALWIHNIDKMKEFFDNLNYQKYKHIVFVSQTAKENFNKIMNCKNTVTIYNLVNAKNILKKSEEAIELSKQEADCITFLNVGRHEEKAKKLTKLIECAKKLKEEKYNFKILMIGAGQDTQEYKELVKKYDLEKEVIFLGKKKNPYPYFKISDCIILTSDYEGYPVVYQEAFVLNLPIITTDVSDSRLDVANKYGIVTRKKHRRYI